MKSSGSTRLSSRPRDGDIREQRPDAALDVLCAGLRETWTARRRKGSMERLPFTQQ